MLTRTEGIVIRSREYGEADLIVTFLTSDLGLINVFAKSPRKTKSRFGSSLEPLSYVKMAFWGKEHSSLPRLTQADIIKTFQGVRESYETFVAVSELLDLLVKCCPEGDASPQMFRYLLRVLSILEHERPAGTVFLALKIKLLRIAGFAPRLDACGKCGKEANLFHFDEGTVMCPACRRGSNHSQRLSPGAVKLYECLLKWKTENVSRVRSGEALLKELTSIMDAHIKYYITRETRHEQVKCPA